MINDERESVQVGRLNRFGSVMIELEGEWC